MHTFTQHRHEPPHYNTTNRHNLFTDIYQYNYRIEFKISTLTFKVHKIGHPEHFKPIVADKSVGCLPGLPKPGLPKSATGPNCRK